MEIKLTNFFRKNTFLVLAIMILLVGIVAFWQFFSIEKLFVFTGFADDSYTSYMPSWYVDQRLSDEGLLSTYSFYNATGNSYVQNIPTDPVGFICFWIRRFMMSLFGVDGTAIAYFYIKFFVSFFATGLFTYLWLRSLYVSKFASLIAGIFAAFSGGTVVLSAWNIEMYGFYLVFYLFSCEQLLTKKRPYFFAIAISMLASQPYQLYLYTLFVAVYLLLRVLVLKFNFKKLCVTALWIIGMGIVGILLNFPDFINSLNIQLNTPRMTGANEINDFAKSFFVDTEMMTSIILRLFGHNIPGDDFYANQWNNYLEAPALYCGMLTLIVFPQIFQFLNVRKKIIYSSFLAIWFLILFINPLRQFLLLNAGDYFRYGIDFFFIFAMLFVMAQSLSVLMIKKRVNIPVLLLSTIVCLLLVWKYSRNDVAVYDEELQKPLVLYVSVAMLIFDTILLFILENFNNRQVIKISICCVALFEVFVLTNSAFNTRSCLGGNDLELNMGDYDDGTSNALEKIRQQDSSKFYRVLPLYKIGKSMHTSVNGNQVLGFFTTLGYNSFNQLEYVKFLQTIGQCCPDKESNSRWLQGGNSNIFSMSFLGIKYLITNTLDTTSLPNNLLKNNKKFAVGNHLVIQLGSAMPLGFAVDKYLSENELKQLLTFHISQNDFDEIYKQLEGSNLELNFEVSQFLSSLINKDFNSYDELKQSLYGNIPDEYAHIVSSTMYIVSHKSLLLDLVLLNAVAFDETVAVDTNKYKKCDVDFLNHNVINGYDSYDIFDSICKNNIREGLEISSFTNNHIKGNVNLSSDKILVLTIPYDKNWNCKIDGNNSVLKRCDSGFSCVELSKGNHEVELEFVPPFRNIAIWIAIVVALLFYSWIVFLLRQEEKLRKRS